MEEDFLSSGLPEEYKMAAKMRRRSTSEPHLKEKMEMNPVKSLLKAISDIPKPKNVSEIDLDSIAFALNSNLLGIKKKSARSGLRKYTDAFTARDAITWIVNQFDLNNREEGVEIGEQLLSHGIIGPIKKVKKFKDNEDSYCFTENFFKRVDEHNKLQRETLVRYRYPSLYRFNDKWVNEKERASHFEDFLKSEHADENLAFYNKIQNYKRCREEERKEMAKSLYDTFVVQDSLSAVNLTGDTVEQIEKELEESPQNIFRGAEAEVSYLLSADCFSRFRQTKFFQEALELHKRRFYERLSPVIPRNPIIEEKKKRAWLKKSSKFSVKAAKHKSMEDDTKLRNFLVLLQQEEVDESSTEISLYEDVKKRQDSVGVRPPKRSQRSMEDADTKVVKAKSAIIAPSFFSIRHEEEIARLQLGLIEDYNEPQVLFFVEANQYKAYAKRRRATKAKAKAQAVYERYLAPHSAFKVELPEEVMSKIEKSMEDPSPEIFDEALNLLSDKVYADQYLHFLSSDHFLEMLHTLWQSSEKKNDKK